MFEVKLADITKSKMSFGME